MATSTLGSGTLVLAGTTSGTTTVTATAVAGTTTLTLPAATDTLVGKATTDTLTNKTLTGAAMNGTVGATTPSTGAFTTLTSTSASSFATSSGNVGVGTSSPALPFHVYNASAALAYFESTSASGPYVIWRSSGTSIGDIGASLGISGSGAATDFMIASRSSPLLFGVGSAEKMRLDSSGNLLVGTTSATSFKFKAVGTGGNLSGNAYYVGLLGDGSASNKGVGLGYDSSSQTGIVYAETASAASNLAFWTYSGSAWGERIRIDSSGNLLVGTTSSSGTISNTAALRAGIFSTNTGSTSAANNTATTLATLSSGLGTYIISIGFNGVGDASTYSAVSIVNVDTTTTKKTDLVTSTGMVITLSGLAIQGRQTAGSTLNISWSILRIQ